MRGASASTKGVTMSRHNFCLDPALVAELRTRAHKENASMSELIREALTQYLRVTPKTPAKPQ